jgi:hypothetical protein
MENSWEISTTDESTSFITLSPLFWSLHKSLSWEFFSLNSYKEVVMVAYKILRATFIITGWDEKA